VNLAARRPPRHPARPGASSSNPEGPNGGLSIELPASVVESVAERTAEIVIERLGEPDGYMDVEGAARFLSCPKSRIYALTSAARVPHHRDGTRLLFDRGELRRWVAAGGAKRP
jgi:excisionase family DNA binding protein